MNTYLIQNGHLIDPKNKRNGRYDIFLKRGKVAEVAEKIEEKEGVPIIDATEKLVFPGLVDLQVHLREPGREDRETIESGLRAAIHGGITSVVSMPNLNPIADNQATILFQKEKARALKLANLFPAGAISHEQKGKRLSEMREMKLAGAVAVTDDGVDVQNAGLLEKAMEWAKTFDLPILSHCEEESLHDHGVMHEGKWSTKMGLSGISAEVEDYGVFRSLLLAQKTGVRFHALHCSTAGGLDAIRRAKKTNANISCETCPQYFSLTDAICKNYNTNGKMYPPIRDEKHQKAVLEALADGTIDAISTDHAPHLSGEKIMPFSDAPPGSTGLETSLAVSYTYLVKTNILTMEQLIEKMSRNPARIIGVDRGHLSVGAIADVVIFDAKKKWTVDSSAFETKGQNCVFEGMELYGKAEMVLVEGENKMRKNYCPA